MEDRIAFYFTEKGEYASREGIPFVKRENVAAIIKYEDKYLLLSWNEVDYDKSLVTGGIDEGEDKIEAVKREVIEETGYHNFKSIEKVDCINVSRFYVEHKNQNREAIYYPYLVELSSLDKNEVDNFEEKEHTCIWLSEEEIDKIDIFDNHRRMLDEALKLVNNKK